MMDSADLQHVLQRLMIAQRHTDRWKGNIRKWRKYYDGIHYDGPPLTDEVRYNDPTYQNTVDLAVGIMLANELNWKVSGSKPSLAEEEASSHIEKFLAGAWCINDEREEANLKYEIFLNFVRDGGAVIYSVWDNTFKYSGPKEFPSEDEEEGVEQKYVFDELPLRIKVIDPLTFFALPGGPKRWLVAGRLEKKTVLDIELTYGVKLEDFNSYDEMSKSATDVDFIDYWEFHQTPDGVVVRNCCLANQKPIPGYELREMPGYTDLPYTVQFFKPTDRSESNKWYSIISPLEDSVRLLERSVNRRQRQIDVYSSLPLITKTHPGKQVHINGLGNSVNIATDESVEFPTWPGNAPDVQLQIDMYRSRIQQSGFSDVMFGSGANQVAGYALSQLGDQNRIRLEQPVAHLELLFTSWAKKALKLSSNFSANSKVKVYGTSKGEDFSDLIDLQDAEDYVVHAEIRPSFPNEEVRRHAMATQVKGVLSEYTIMQKYLGVQQPDEEFQRRIIEAATKHPVMVNYAIMLELSERAKAGDEVTAMTLQAMQNGNISGEPGRPKEPNAPEQPLGLQSPTGSPLPTNSGEPDMQNQMEAMAGASPTMGGTINGA